MDSHDPTPALTPACVASLAKAAGIAIEPERLPMVLAVLTELLDLEREIEPVDASPPGNGGFGTGGRP